MAESEPICPACQTTNWNVIFGHHRIKGHYCDIARQYVFFDAEIFTNQVGLVDMIERADRREYAEANPRQSELEAQRPLSGWDRASRDGRFHPR